MFKNVIKRISGVALIALASSSVVASPTPSLWRGDQLPESGVLVCRSGESDKPVSPEVPPTLRIDYSKSKAWVKVTLGGQVFEKTHPLLKDGPKSWGGDIERGGWAVNVAVGPKIRGWSWFTMANDRVDWRGYCELEG